MQKVDPLPMELEGELYNDLFEQLVESYDRPEVTAMLRAKLALDLDDYVATGIGFRDTVAALLVEISKLELVAEFITGAREWQFARANNQRTRSVQKFEELEARWAAAVNAAADSPSLIPSLTNIADLRDEFAEEISAFREFVLARDMAKAGDEFRYIEDSFVKLTTHPERGRLRNESRQRDLAQAVWELLSAEGDIGELVGRARGWPAECVTAYLIAYESHGRARLSEFRAARLHLPSSSVDDPTLIGEIERLNIDESNIQPRKWPLPDANRRLIVDWDNPFAFSTAEQDRTPLFSSDISAFWPHQLYFTLDRLNESCIVSAAAGHGKSALALALGRYHGRETQLSLYMPANAPTEEVYTGFSDRLLDFVIAHPTLLTRLRKNTRNMLARFIVLAIGRELPLNRIEVAQDDLDLADWLIRQPSERQDYWKQMAVEHFNQLAESIQAVESKPVDKIPPSRNWPRNLRQVGSALGFSRILLVLDATTADHDRLAQLVQSQLREWYADRNGFKTFLFVSNEQAAQLDLGSQLLEHKSLVWERQELVNMVLHRYRAFSSERSDITDVLEESGLETLVQLSQDAAGYSPRRFIEAWNAAGIADANNPISRSDLLPIFKDEIEAVVADFGSADDIQTQLARLRTLMMRHLTISSLTQISQQLGLSYDELPGDKKQEKLVSMIINARRSGRLSDLVALCQQFEPKTNWPSLSGK